MKIFCETVFEEILPGLRAIVTNEMIKTYGLTQSQVAKKLGITQPAVSQYKKGLRGKNVKMIMSNKKFMKCIKKLTEDIINGKTTFHKSVCMICKIGRKDEIFSKKEMQPFLCLIKMSQRSK